MPSVFEFSREVSDE